MRLGLLAMLVVSFILGCRGDDTPKGDGGAIYYTGPMKAKGGRGGGG